MALILYIEDNQAHIDAITLQVEKMGHIVISATDGEEGLELVRNANPDLILLDLVMPKMDGFEILEKLRIHKITGSIPVIILSATTKKEDIIKAKKYNVFSYMTKKFHVKTFREKIDNALKYNRFLIKDKIEKNRPIIITQHTGRTTISFHRKLNEKSIMDEAKKLLSGDFIRNIRENICILDFRYLPEYKPEDIEIIDRLINLIPDHSLYIIAGRHYGAIMLERDFPGRIIPFISHNDMENYIYNEDL